MPKFVEDMPSEVSPSGGAIRCVQGYGHHDEETPRLKSPGRRPKLGPPDLLISYGWFWDDTICPKGEQIWRIVARFYPLCAPLPRPADWVAVKALEPSFFHSKVHPSPV